MGYRAKCKTRGLDHTKHRQSSIFVIDSSSQLLYAVPIFHRKLGLRLVTNANEIYTNNIKFTWGSRWPFGLAGLVLAIWGHVGVTLSPQGLSDTNMLVVPMRNCELGPRVGLDPQREWFRFVGEYRLNVHTSLPLDAFSYKESIR